MILFLFALTMIFSDGKPKVVAAEAEKRSPAPAADPAAAAASLAVFPLAVPSLASPGAMLAVVLLTDNNRLSIAEQTVTARLMLAVIAAAYGARRAAGSILRAIGPSGAAIVSRVTGMILAAVAVDNVIAAVIEPLRTVQI